MQKLLSLALVFSLLGLLSLVFLAEFSEIEQVSVSELEYNIGKRVEISGDLIKVGQKPTVSFFELQDETGKVDIVAFGEIEKLEVNSSVKVSGKVDIYKGELEVIAESITAILQS